MGELSPSPPRETRNPPPTPACNLKTPLFAVWGCQREVALSLLPEGLSPGSRLYGIKCAKCSIGFSKNDFVMRARAKVYHIECFRCVACSRQLIPGDEFALREDGLFCRADHDVVERASLGAGDPLSPLHPARPLQMAGTARTRRRGSPRGLPPPGPAPGGGPRRRQRVPRPRGKEAPSVRARGEAAAAARPTPGAAGSGCCGKRPRTRYARGGGTCAGGRPPASLCPSCSGRAAGAGVVPPRGRGSREPRSERDEPLAGAGLRQSREPSASGACGKAGVSTGGSGVRKEVDFITTGEHLGSEPISARQPALRPHVHKQPEKTTRVRTVLNEKQLHTLRTCYAANPRPDALMKEQLVEMTGLSPRVIRVWFQNKRCKDKKRSIMMKQLQQQQPNDKTNIQGMTGTPMVAASPERHDGGLQANPVEVQSYQPPWKVLSDFALQSDIDQPAFQQLVNFSEGGPGSNSTGSEVASMSSQLPDTPNSMVASPIEA
ncbi:hypothetical protein QYF61_025432 [Mycteria americana]|uniref:Insulin gene enhancer protein ISL-1 n=3 Tax=Neoaves TaxID=3078114 RepID=A0AAN7NS23_MYCAM|nr:hypothetical protein QYF61_025432 [Mycteria americana]